MLLGYHVSSPWFPWLEAAYLSLTHFYRELFVFIGNYGGWGRGWGVVPDVGLFAFFESAVALENGLCFFDLKHREDRWSRKGTLHLFDAEMIYLHPYPVSYLSLWLLWRPCHRTYQRPIFILSVWILITFISLRPSPQQLYLISVIIQTCPQICY